MARFEDDRMARMSSLTRRLRRRCWFMAKLAIIANDVVFVRLRSIMMRSVVVLGLVRCLMLKGFVFVDRRGKPWERPARRVGFALPQVMQIYMRPHNVGAM